MKRSRVAALAILLFAHGASAQNTAGVLTFAEYTQRLDDIASRLDAAPPVGRTNEAAPVYPSEWIVGSDGGRFIVDARQIDADFGAWTQHADADARARLTSHLQDLQQDAAEFSRQPADRSAARSELAGILATSEFRPEETNWQERIRSAVLRGLEAILRPIFRSALVPIVSRSLVYVLIAAALGLLAFWAYRAWPGASSTVSFATAAVVPQRSWQAWRTAADTAAADGRWREAIHCAYWCAVLALETRGAWRPDPARTPREYVRAMSEHDRHRAAFSVLTDSFEQVWYASRDANNATFAEAVARLSELGC